MTEEKRENADAIEAEAVGAAPSENAAAADEGEAGTTPEDEIRNAAAEARKFQDLYLRSAAEMDNLRRRFQREREDLARFAAENVIKSLLPALDNLSLALNFVRADAPAESLSLAEGVRLTLKGLLDTLGENGLKPAPAERGEPFDPNLHEAIGQRPEADLPAGSVCQTVQSGYLLHDRLIRPAKVIVAAAPESPAD